MALLPRVLHGLLPGLLSGLPAGLLLATSHLGLQPAAAQDLPNIVVVYADDLGYGDLSAYNPDAAYETPRLDRMAAEGIRFTDAHSPSTICSPSATVIPSRSSSCSRPKIRLRRHNPW